MVHPSQLKWLSFARLKLHCAQHRCSIHGCWSSFIRERPFFANKQFTFAKLSRPPCLSFVEPILSNNSSSEDSSITCQITPNCQRLLLHSLANMQLASRNPLLRPGCCWSGDFFARVTGPLPSKCALTFARSFAELSWNFRENIPICRPPSAGGASKEKQTPGALAFCFRKASKLGCFMWSLLLETSESIVRQYQRQVRMRFKTTVFGCGEASPSVAPLLPMKGKMNVWINMDQYC